MPGSEVSDQHLIELMPLLVAVLQGEEGGEEGGKTERKEDLTKGIVDLKSVHCTYMAVTGERYSINTHTHTHI